MLKRCTAFVFIAGIAVQWSSPGRAYAHQQWVLPNFFVTESKDDSVWLGFEHALGDRRFVSSVGPGPAMLWVVGPGDEWTPPSFAYAGKTRTVAEIELKQPGTYRVIAEEPEAYWTRIVEGKKKRWLRVSRDRAAGKKVDVSKRFWARSSTYVTFRKKTKEPLAAQGDPLELLPIDHPNAASTGQPFRVRVLASGAPLAGAKVKIYDDTGEGHDATFTLASDVDGRAQINFPKAGRYLFSVRHEVPAKNDPKADAYVYSVHLMVEASARASAVQADSKRSSLPGNQGSASGN